MIDEFGRPDWNTFWITLCFIISQKSLDPSTKHGCVVIDDENTLLSLGYNSPPRKCIEKNIPLERPLKYKYMEHAESNAINNAARVGTCLKNSIFYITGHPCESCFRRMINVGVKKIIYGPVGSHCIDEEGLKVIDEMKIGQNIEMIQYKEDKKAIIAITELLAQTTNYMIEKNRL